MTAKLVVNRNLVLAYTENINLVRYTAHLLNAFQEQHFRTHDVSPQFYSIEQQAPKKKPKEAKGSVKKSRKEHHEEKPLCEQFSDQEKPSRQLVFI
jgi:hypothetical protein